MSAIPVIAGPTAGGKTDLAIEVALAMRERGTPGEVVTADAYQIYRGMDIGTAKPTPEERRSVPHHLIDVVEPTERFTASDWLSAARGAIAEIRSRGHVPIVVGGTHLYVKSLLDGMFEGPGADEALRAELHALGRDALRAELQRVDPAAAAKLHPNDLRRTVRAIEVFRLTGKPISEHQRQWDLETPTDTSTRLITLEWPTESINPRINARVKAMLAAGLVEEVRGLWSARRLGPQAREALGYKQLVDHLEGRCTLDEAVERIKIETRRLGKNQRTWLRRLRTTPGMVCIDATETPREAWVTRVLGAIGAG